LIEGLLNKLNEEIKNNPTEEIFRKINSLIASKLDNNLELFNKIIEIIQPEIISLEINDKNEKLFLYDVEALNNICRYNIVPRILMKKEKESFLNKLKQLYNNNSINEKLKYMLANIFSNLIKNKVNHEKLIQNHSDFLAKILENLEDPNSKNIFGTKIETQLTNLETMNTELLNDDQYQSTNFNQNNKYIETIIPTEANDNTNVKELLNKNDDSPLCCHLINLEQLELFKKKEIEKKTLDKQIYSFVRLVKQNIGQLIKLNIVDKKNLENLKKNFESDKNIIDLIDNILKNLTNRDKENELIDTLNNLKFEIDALCKFVSEAYKEHCNKINFNNSLNDENISDSRQDNIIRRSIRLSVQNVVAKISASSKKMSIFSMALNFTKKNSNISSPLSSKDNEDIQSTIEKMLNHLMQLYTDLKNDIDTKRNLERRILMSSLLNGLKLLSVAPSNHVQILELGMLNFIEKINHDTEELNTEIKNNNSICEDKKIKNDFIPAFLQFENLDIIKNCTTSESAIPLFISSQVADKIILEIFDIYKNPNIIQNDENLRSKFRSSNKIFSNLCQNKKGFNFVFDKLGLEKLLELAKNTYDETIIDSILEMIINFINNNTKSEIEKYLMNIFMIVKKAYKIFDNNREKVDLLTNAILIIGLLCSDETQEIINQFDFAQETCKFDLNFLLSNLQFLNAFSFALGKLSYNNPKISRSCFETGIIYKLNDLIPETLNILNNNSILNKLENVDEAEKTKQSKINFSFLENISSLYRNILKNNLKIIPKFLEKNPLANEPNKLKFLRLKNSEIEIISYMLTIMEKLIETHLNSSSSNITIYNLAESFEFICMDENAIFILANTYFMNLCIKILTVKQGEAEIVRILMLCISNYFNKEIGNNFNNSNFEKILEILRGIQKRYYLNSDILMTINNISYCLFNNLIKEKDKLTKENLFNIILESINIQDWNIPLLLTALKIIYEILRKKENKYIIDLIYDDHINSFFGIIRNHQNDSEIICVDYKIISLFAENSIHGYAMINNNLLELIQDTLVKLVIKPDIDLGKITSAKDFELKQTIFCLLEKLCNDKNSAKKIADAITENLIMELKAENPAAPSVNASNILKLFQTITQHPNTVEGFLQQNGLEYILNFLKMDPHNINNDLNCLRILEHISKNGNNYKKKLKEAKTVEVISDVMEKTKNINKEIYIIGGMIINDINEIQFDLQKSEELNIEEVKKKSSPIKPEIKNFLTNGKIVRL